MATLKSSSFNLLACFFIAVLAVVAVFCYFFVDGYIISCILSDHRGLNTFKGASIIREFGKIYVPLWLLFLWGFFKKNLQIVLAGSMAMLLALAIVCPVKVIAHRQRPYTIVKNSQVVVQEQQQNKTELQSFSLSSGGTDSTCVFISRDYFKQRNQSFPSGDTAAVFAPTVVILYFVSFLCWPILFIPGCLIGFMRVAGLSHYPSDVFAGAAIGVFCGWIAVRISGQWISRNLFFVTEWGSKAVIIGIFLIPSLSFFLEGAQTFLIFLASSVILATFIFVADKITKLW